MTEQRLYTNDQDELTIDLRAEVWTPQRKRTDKAFKEDEHPRADDGKFTGKQDASGKPWLTVEKVAARDAEKMIEVIDDTHAYINLSEAARRIVKDTRIDADMHTLWYTTGVFNVLSGAQEDRIESDAHSAIADYVANSMDLNNYLRSGKFSNKSVYNATEDEIKDLTKTLDATFKDAPFKIGSDTTVYRGFTPGTPENSSVEAEQAAEKFYDRLDEGDVLEDRGFLSTSTQPQIAYSFGRILAEINLPRGQKVLIGAASETEFILPRGMRLRVVKKELRPSSSIRGGASEEHVKWMLLEPVNA